MLKKPTISPKRSSSFYNRTKSHQKLIKPQIKSYKNTKINKRNSNNASLKIYSKNKSRIATENSEKKSTGIIRKVLHRSHKLNKNKIKIFKLIDECLQMIRSGNNYNCCISKLITIDRIVAKSFDKHDVVAILIKFLIIR